MHIFRSANSSQKRESTLTNTHYKMGQITIDIIPAAFSVDICNNI